MTDSQLLKQLKAGDSTAVESWHQQYHPKLLEYVQSKVRVRKDAEEVTQDIFMSCLKHLPLFRGDSSIWTWMRRIARHEIADYYRKYYAKKTIHALSLEAVLLDQPVKDAHHTAEMVKAALNKIRPDYRELLLLKYVDNLKVKEIAQRLGRTIKSIESDLFRARQDFRVIYAQVEERW